MAGKRIQLADAKRILLAVFDGSEFPEAMAALREAGFQGETTVLAYAEWRPLLEGQCARIADFPDSQTSERTRSLALLRRIPGLARKADAIVWAGPWGRKSRYLLRALALRKPVFCFHEGRPAPFDPAKTPSRPGIDNDGAREKALAIQYLRPLLEKPGGAHGSLRLGVDGDGIHAREATGVQWCRRHLFAEFCAEELDIELNVASPVTEARSIWELPWSARMRRIPPPLAAYTPKDRESAAPIEAITGPVDLFHQTFFDPPKFRYRKVVATVHDIMPLTLPEAFPQRFIDRLRAIEPFWRDECARLICVSEATRNDLESVMDIPKNRTVCIPNGKHPHFTPRGEAEIAAARARYGLGKPYLMALGSVVPHKNLSVLCQAFAKMKRSTGAPHQLVIVGRPGWLIRDVLDGIAKSGVAEDVVFTGYADWCDLPALYSGAAAFCMPSLYEGYGIPVQEALCCACPVLLSDCTALPEVAGEAGIYWNPRDVNDMAAKIQGFIEDGAAQEAARERARERSKAFMTWREVALAHRRVYEAVLAEG